MLDYLILSYFADNDQSFSGGHSISRSYTDDRLPRSIESHDSLLYRPLEEQEIKIIIKETIQNTHQEIICIIPKIIYRY